MGASTEQGNATREHRPRTAGRHRGGASHQNAAASREFLAGEIVAYDIEGKGGTVAVAEDDGVRPETTVETLAGLRPAFTKGRHDHGGQRLADHRRRRGARAHECRRPRRRAG